MIPAAAAALGVNLRLSRTSGGDPPVLLGPTKVRESFPHERG